jgi:primosomal protein N'
MTECHHPSPPTNCRFCGSTEVVVSVDGVGSCYTHIDDIFEEAAMPLMTLLTAAIEAFGDQEEA